MSNYPAMVIRMANLEPALQPPYAMGEFEPDRWHIQNGVVIPNDANVLSVYKELQRQINRLLVHGGMGVISVDGYFGKATQGALLRSLRYARSLGHAPPIPVSQYVVNNQMIPLQVIATNGGELAAAISQIAARLQARTVVDPPASKPAQPAAGGGVVTPPVATMVAQASPSFLDNLGVPKPLALAAAGVLVLAIFKRKKNSRGRGRR